MKPKKTSLLPTTPTAAADPRIKVGTYQLGFQAVELYVNPEQNGGTAEWDLKDGKKEMARITVGIDHSRWYCYGTLVHEVMEFACFQMGCSWSPHRSFSPRQTDGFMFVLSHKQFDEATQWTGSFINDCKADFDKAYKKHHRKA